MTRYVAFLRAINVGGHVVKMTTLRALFEAMGAASVETFIASGNVIFETSRRHAAGLEADIEARLHEALGFPVTTFLRTLPEVAAAAAHCPFARSEFQPDAALYIGFLKTAPGAAACASVAGFSNPSHEFVVCDREIYWLRRDRLIELSNSGKGLDKIVGGVTFRNVTTVRKIAAKWPPAAPARPR
jgi:uncharacterized protein (DUF1697 family)